ncbi:Asparagine synthetase domain-containing protein 1 [Nowakowskiella sp. JEL0078]|nr:Asparagine synthetase domain-containing protein 1 [Nowakowskiella sp. JEL0078]
MCGILVSLSFIGKKSDAQLIKALSRVCDRRGPDCQKTELFSFSHVTSTGLSEATNHPWYNLSLRGSVLHLRGLQPTHQPVKMGHDYLLFNGEIFGGLEVNLDQNDTSVLSDTITKTLNEYSTKNEPPDSKAFEKTLLKVLSQIRGEWAIVIYEYQYRRLWFGRDYLGRRSLLWSWGTHIDPSFVLTSTSAVGFSPECDKRTWEEVPADGLYCLEMDKYESVNREALKHYPWGHTEDAHLHGIMKAPYKDIEKMLPTDDTLTIPESCKDPLAISNEVDEKAVSGLLCVLQKSVQRRAETIPDIIKETTNISPARLGILFSGGLDCMCLAAIVNKCIPENEPIDLLNVSFENPRIQKARNEERNKHKKKGLPAQNDSIDNETKKYEVPDRLTGIRSVEELRKIYPLREWRFVEINVPFEEAMNQKSHILSLIAPLETVMDLSIAMAFWFAARGIGNVRLHEKDLIYKSQAKVLFSGLGADEQMGGYGRHAVGFRQNGWQGLLHEVELDVQRISVRNMGRDDRIVSDHGKEVRFPFLDEEVVDYLSRQPIHLKVDPRFSKGIGEKIILRRLAHNKLKIIQVAREPKRAVQFGARTARMVSSEEKGTDML